MTMAAHAHPSAGAVEGEQANLLIQRGFLEYVQLEQMDNKKKQVTYQRMLAHCVRFRNRFRIH